MSAGVQNAVRQMTKQPVRGQLMRNIFLRTVGLGLLAVGSIQAATNTINFNTDPLPGPPPALYRDVGAGEWRPNGGASGQANDGYLKISDAAGGQVAKLVFKDLEGGLVVKAFSFECDVRVGGGTARPADGFSINYVDINDSMILNSDAGSATDIGDYAGTDNEVSLPEEGGKTGLGIGFDTWESATIVGVQDVAGISVRVGGVLVAQFPVPLLPGNVFSPGEPNPVAGTEVYNGPEYTYNGVPHRNLATNAPNYLASMQTGGLNTTDDLNGDGTVDAADAGAAQPAFGDPTWDLWIKNLKWEKFRAEILEDGKVKVFWKGVELTPAGGLQTDYVPIAGRIVFGGRTGGAWEVHHIDNITLITVPANDIIVGNATGLPNGFTIPVTDSGPSILDPASIQLQLNGNPVTATGISKAGAVTTIYYSGPTPLAAGTTNRVDLTVSDTRTPPIVVSGGRNFVVPVYSTVPAAWAVAAANTPGFKLKVHQIAPVQGLPNTVARAERQLHGDIGANVALTVPGPDGYVTQDGVINFNQDSPGAAGNYNTANGFEDQPIPGIDLVSSPHTDNIAMEILTYIEFPTAGAYQLIFNSDDGFRTLIGNKAVDVIASPIISEADIGRGAVDTLRNLYVPQAGIFPVRTIWFEGGGGASLEWVGVNLQTGVKALINDTTTVGSLKAFRVATGTFPAAVTYAYPDRTSGNPYFPTDPITIELTDGTALVNGGSIQLSVNDAPVTVTPAKVGAVTKIQYTPANPWPSGSNNKITLVWSDNATPAVVWSNSWNFTVRPWVTIPATATIPAASVNLANVGFKLRTHHADQQNDLENSSARAIAQLGGAFGPNKVDTSIFGADGYFAETTVVNYEQGTHPALTPTAGYDSTLVVPVDSGNFFDTAPVGQENADRLFPGYPITDATFATLVYSNKWHDNIAMEILTVLDLQPGFYWDGVNSDDGFKVSFAANPLDVGATVANVFEGGKGASDVSGLYQVTQAGLYPVRVIWYEGGGGASMEWFLQNTLNNQRILVNDTATPGHVKAYQYPVAAPPAAFVKSVTPAAGAQAVLGVGLPRVGLGKKVEAVIVDGATAIDQNSIQLKINGTAVTPITKNKVGNETTVTYTQPLPAGQLVTVELDWTDSGPRSSIWSFTTGVLPGNTFVVEAEDFNTGGGLTVAASSTMPYAGNAYSNLNAVLGIDYLRPHQGDSPLYRFGETNSVPLAGYPAEVNVPMDATGDVDRGGSDLTVNYKIGWTGANQWYNYTRTFPAGNYNVYAGLSQGDPITSASRVRGTLQQITAGATTTNQTVVQLGTFDGPATGGWGVNRLVPLMNASVVASVPLSGAQTIRFTTDSGDYDFLAFVPAVAQININTVTVTAGQVTVNWTGGINLQSSPSLATPNWQDILGATTGTYTAPVTGSELYFRVRGP
jgi:hypothetical protein